jgi:5-methylcytosine-specific restriction endonuclease McrA
VTTKQCSKCCNEKVFSDFRKSSATKDGLQNYCRACHNLANKHWRENNRKKHLEYLRQWHSENREQSRESNRQWGKRNKELKRLKDARRRATIKNNGVFSILPKEWHRLYSSPCLVCGSRNGVAADHVMPLSRGGRHSIGNLQPLCKPCNSSKKDRLMVEWRNALGKQRSLSARVDCN